MQKIPKTLLISLVALFSNLYLISDSKADLSIITSFENSKVLPQKIRNAQFHYLSIGLSDVYGNTGASGAISSKLSKSVTWNDLVEGKDTSIEQEELKSALQSFGYSLDGTPGSTSADIDANISVMAPVLAYGVNEKLTLALAVPVYRTTMNVDTSFVKSESGQGFADNLIAAGNVPTAQFFTSEINDPIQSKLNKNGYKPLESFDEQSLGDMKLVGKYLAYQGNEVSHSIKSTLTLPTGRQSDADRIVDIPTGDGQFDLGLMYILGYSLPNSNLPVTFNAYSSYTAQLPDHVEARVPEERGEKITPDKDPNIKRDMGDIIGAGLGIGVELLTGLTLAGSYNVQYKFEDKFEGSLYEKERYDYMSDETRKRLQNVLTGITYSTVPAFRKGKFPAPGLATLKLAMPVEGKNVPDVTALSLETSLFF